MYSGEKNKQGHSEVTKLHFVHPKIHSKSYNKPVDVEVLAITTFQKEKREKKIKDSASTTDTKAKWSICTKHRNGANRYKFTQSRQQVNSHTQRGKNKAATMLKNTKETELISENNRKKVEFICILMHRKHEQEWFW